MRVFVTGAAGFIGYHLSRKLLEAGDEVVGYDAITDYYDPKLKLSRLKILREFDGFKFHQALLEDASTLHQAVADSNPELVVHLAAQAGVRYSLENPAAYVSGNLVGTANLLETCRRTYPGHLMLASSSSVYGGNTKLPYRESHPTDHPVSLYAATKKSTEVMAHSYSHLFDLPITCFRFFTVYGPWGRPDMALFKFVEAIKQGHPIDVYGMGKMRRDFTYIDDLVASICQLSMLPPTQPPREGKGQSPHAPFRIVNIAGGKTVTLLDFIRAIESALGMSAQKNLLPMQAGDVVDTHADTALLRSLIGNIPSTSVRDGVQAFVDWHTAEF